MKSRIQQCFSNIKKTGEKALVTFITAGDPDLTTTASMLKVLEEAGADIIELGIPFSDPMADGPTIQRASERALANGVTLKDILALVKQARQQVSVPIVLMGYSNPVYAYGWQRFTEDAVQAGVDGLLLVDLPPEEADELLPAAQAAGLEIIFLLTPTSDVTRIKRVSRSGSGYVYYVTVTGVTGTRQSVSDSLANELETVRRMIKLPVAAGFGISTPEQAAQVAAAADGVVVGSAIVKLFEHHHGTHLQQEVAQLVRSLKQAIS